MDRKFIAEHCKKCWHSLDVFGLWCAYKGVNVKKMMCSAVERCMYSITQEENISRSDEQMIIWKEYHYDS